MKTSKQSAVLRYLLIVIASIVVFSLLAPRLGGPRLPPTKTQIAGTQIKALGGALHLFRVDTGRYPNANEGLQALLANRSNQPSWKGPYVQYGHIPNDPWGRAYVYRLSPQEDGYVLISYGRDGMPGGEGEDQDLRTVLK